MDVEQLRAGYLPFAQKYWLAIGFSCIGLLLLSIGIVSMIVSEKDNSGVIIEEAASTKQEVEKIVVDVAGSVEKPGLYKLSQGARLQEALIAAGGFSSSADRLYIAKNLNLASKLSDGAKIYIPDKSQSANLKAQDLSGVVVGATSELININTASESDLESLPGVGPVTAGKIINGRPYGSVEELLTKKVLGQSVFGKIKEKISLY